MSVAVLCTCVGGQVRPSALLNHPTTQPNPPGITAGIVVANHQYEGDWWYMLMVARFLGLHGNVKIIVRALCVARPLKRQSLPT